MDYLLPCCSCGKKLTISSAQAGQSLPCACGQWVEVPAMRHLRDLEAADVAERRPSTWNRRKGLVFLGCCILLVSAALGGYLWWQLPRAGDPAAIRAEIDAVDPATLFVRFQALRQSAHPESPEDKLILAPVEPLLKSTFEDPWHQFLAPREMSRFAVDGKQRESLIYWLPLLGGFAVIGLLTALSALLVRVDSPRSPQRRATASSR